MESDLVKRLRKLYEQGYPPISALEEAADRIEALEAALRGMLDQAEACWQHHYGHMSEDEMATVPQHIADARAALPRP